MFVYGPEKRNFLKDVWGKFYFRNGLEYDGRTSLEWGC